MDYHFDQIYDCITIESNVLYKSEFNSRCLSCMNILCSLRKRSGLKIDLNQNFNPTFLMNSTTS